jgi:hypothetical protein
MSPLAGPIRYLWQYAFMLLTLLIEATRLLRLCLHPPAVLAAENLFLRTQLALYQKRQVTPRRATDAARFTLVWLSQWFDSGGRTARDLQAVAAARVPPLPTLHLVPWTACNPGRVARAHPADGA